ncbi:MAG: hypothetical protein ACOYNZ_09315 [Rhodoferax sp.]
MMCSSQRNFKRVVLLCLLLPVLSACGPFSSDSSSQRATVKITDYQLGNYSFELPDGRWPQQGKPLAVLSLQLAAQQSGVDSLELAFKLVVPGVVEPFLLKAYSSQDAALTGLSTVSNLNQDEPQAITYYLYMDDYAYSALAAIDQARTCQLRIVLDPQQKAGLTAQSDGSTQIALEYLPRSLFVWTAADPHFEKYFGHDEHLFKTRWSYNSAIKPAGPWLQADAKFLSQDSARPYVSESTGSVPWTAGANMHQFRLESRVSMEGWEYQPLVLDGMFDFDVVRDRGNLSMIKLDAAGITQYQLFSTLRSIAPSTDFDMPIKAGNIAPQTVSKSIYWGVNLTFNLTFSGTYAVTLAGASGLDPNDSKLAKFSIDRQSAALSVDVKASVNQSGYQILDQTSTIRLMDWKQQSHYALVNRFPSPATSIEQASIEIYFDNPYSYKAGDGKMEMIWTNHGQQDMYPHSPMQQIGSTREPAHSWASKVPAEQTDYWRRITNPVYQVR